VRQTFDIVRRAARRREIAQPHELFDDFADGEVAIDAVQSAGAEDTAHAAADLRADASGAAALVLDQHAFNELVIGEFHKQFVCMITGDVVLGDAARQRRKVFRDVQAQRLGQVGHFVKRLGPAHQDPVPHLFGAHRLLVAFRQPGTQVVLGEGQESRQESLRAGACNDGKIHSGFTASMDGIGHRVIVKRLDIDWNPLVRRTICVVH
jgi:hypothetical protein